MKTRTRKKHSTEKNSKAEHNVLNILYPFTAETTPEETGIPNSEYFYGSTKFTFQAQTELNNRFDQNSSLLKGLQALAYLRYLKDELKQWGDSTRLNIRPPAPSENLSNDAAKSLAILFSNTKEKQSIYSRNDTAVSSNEQNHINKLSHFLENFFQRDNHKSFTSLQDIYLQLAHFVAQELYKSFSIPAAWKELTFEASTLLVAIIEQVNHIYLKPSNSSFFAILSSSNRVLHQHTGKLIKNLMQQQQDVVIPVPVLLDYSLHMLRSNRMSTYTEWKEELTAEQLKFLFEDFCQRLDYLENHNPSIRLAILSATTLLENNQTKEALIELLSGAKDYLFKSPVPIDEIAFLEALNEAIVFNPLLNQPGLAISATKEQQAKASAITIRINTLKLETELVYTAVVQARAEKEKPLGQTSAILQLYQYCQTVSTHHYAWLALNYCYNQIDLSGRLKNKPSEEPLSAEERAEILKQHGSEIINLEEKMQHKTMLMHTVACFPENNRIEKISYQLLDIQIFFQSLLTNDQDNIERITADIINPFQISQSIKNYSLSKNHKVGMDPLSALSLTLFSHGCFTTNTTREQYNQFITQAFIYLLNAADNSAKKNKILETLFDQVLWFLDSLKIQFTSELNTSFFHYQFLINFLKQIDESNKDKLTDRQQHNIKNYQVIPHLNQHLTSDSDDTKVPQKTLLYLTQELAFIEATLDQFSNYIKLIENNSKGKKDKPSLQILQQAYLALYNQFKKIEPLLLNALRENSFIFDSAGFNIDRLRNPKARHSKPVIITDEDIEKLKAKTLAADINKLARDQHDNLINIETKLAPSIHNKKIANTWLARYIATKLYELIGFNKELISQPNSEDLFAELELLTVAGEDDNSISLITWLKNFDHQAGLAEIGNKIKVYVETNQKLETIFDHFNRLVLNINHLLEDKESVQETESITTEFYRVLEEKLQNLQLKKSTIIDYATETKLFDAQLEYIIKKKPQLTLKFLIKNYLAYPHTIIAGYIEAIYKGEKICLSAKANTIEGKQLENTPSQLNTPDSDRIAMLWQELQRFDRTQAETLIQLYNIYKNLSLNDIATAKPEQEEQAVPEDTIDYQSITDDIGIYCHHSYQKIENAEQAQINANQHAILAIDLLLNRATKKSDDLDIMLELIEAITCPLRIDSHNNPMPLNVAVYIHPKQNLLNILQDYLDKLVNKPSIPTDSSRQISVVKISEQATNKYKSIQNNLEKLQSIFNHQQALYRFVEKCFSEEDQGSKKTLIQATTAYLCSLILSPQTTESPDAQAIKNIINKLNDDHQTETLDGDQIKELVDQTNKLWTSCAIERLANQFNELKKTEAAATSLNKLVTNYLNLIENLATKNSVQISAYFSLWLELSKYLKENHGLITIEIKNNFSQASRKLFEKINTLNFKLGDIDQLAVIYYRDSQLQLAAEQRYLNEAALPQSQDQKLTWQHINEVITGFKVVEYGAEFILSPEQTYSVFNLVAFTLLRARENTVAAQQYFIQPLLEAFANIVNYLINISSEIAVHYNEQIKKIIKATVFYLSQPEPNALERFSPLLFENIDLLICNHINIAIEAFSEVETPALSAAQEHSESISKFNLITYLVKYAGHKPYSQRVVNNIKNQIAFHKILITEADESFEVATAEFFEFLLLEYFYGIKSPTAQTREAIENHKIIGDYLLSSNEKFFKIIEQQITRCNISEDRTKGRQLQTLVKIYLTAYAHLRNTSQTEYEQLLKTILEKEPYQYMAWVLLKEFALSESTPDNNASTYFVIKYIYQLSEDIISHIIDDHYGARVKNAIKYAKVMLLSLDAVALHQSSTAENTQAILELKTLPASLNLQEQYMLFKIMANSQSENIVTLNDAKRAQWMVYYQLLHLNKLQLSQTQKNETQASRKIALLFDVRFFYCRKNPNNTYSFYSPWQVEALNNPKAQQFFIEQMKDIINEVAEYSTDVQDGNTNRFFNIKHALFLLTVLRAPKNSVPGQALDQSNKRNNIDELYQKALITVDLYAKSILPQKMGKYILDGSVDALIAKHSYQGIVNLRSQCLDDECELAIELKARAFTQIANEQLENASRNGEAIVSEPFQPVAKQDFLFKPSERNGDIQTERSRKFMYRLFLCQRIVNASLLPNQHSSLLSAANKQLLENIHENIAIIFSFSEEKKSEKKPLVNPLDLPTNIAANLIRHNGSGLKSPKTSTNHSIEHGECHNGNNTSDNSSNSGGRSKFGFRHK